MHLAKALLSLVLLASASASPVSSLPEGVKLPLLHPTPLEDSDSLLSKRQTSYEAVHLTSCGSSGQLKYIYFANDVLRSGREIAGSAGSGTTWSGYRTGLFAASSTAVWSLLPTGLGYPGFLFNGYRFFYCFEYTGGNPVAIDASDNACNSLYVCHPNYNDGNC